MMDTSGFVAPPAVDWWKVFNDLTNAGLVPAEVARRLNIPHAYVYKWRNGDQKPSAEHALIVTAFHAWVMSRRMFHLDNKTIR